MDLTKPPASNDNINDRLTEDKIAEKDSEDSHELVEESEAPSPDAEQEQEHNDDNGVKFTNFLMEEILKPDFGSRRDTETKLFNNYSNSLRCRFDVQSGERNSRTPHEDTGGSDEGERGGSPNKPEGVLWPAWVYCTRYSDRPSSGNRKSICYYLINNNDNIISFEIPVVNRLSCT